MTEKTKNFRERLLEMGVSEEILDKYDLETLEKEMKEAGLEEDYVAKLLQFQDYLENFGKYPRKRVGITLAEPVYELLQYLAKNIETPTGEQYPFSYFVEDILVWLLKNPELFQKFLDETYTEEEEVEEDGSEEEEAEGETD